MIVVSTTLVAAPADEVAEVAGRVAASTTKPVLGCFLAAPDLPSRLPGEEPPQAVPVYGSPEPAARALARAARYGAWRRRRPGTVPALNDADLEAAKAGVEGYLAASPGRRLVDAGVRHPGPVRDGHPRRPRPGGR